MPEPSSEKAEPAAVSAPHAATGAALRRVLMGGAKVAIGLVMAVVALAAIAALIGAVINGRNRELAVRKDWPSIRAPSLGDATFELGTIWRDGKVSFILEVRPYTDRIRLARDRAASSTYYAPVRASFTVRFLDPGGFTVASADVDITSMGRTVDAAGEVLALHTEGFSFLDASDYRRIDRWNVSWSLPD